MSRLFTFGCSFTSYKWPTWADILGKEFSYYENWGRSGAGNHYIFNALNECIARNAITTTDTVIVMWTNVMREDRYINHLWNTPGNIYTQNMYDSQFIKKFVDTRGCLIRDLAFIQSSKLILDFIGCKYIFTSMVPIDTPNQYFDTKIKDDNDVLLCYNTTIKHIRPSVFESIFNSNWNSRPYYSKDCQDEKLRWSSVAGISWPKFEDYILNIQINSTIKKEIDTMFKLHRSDFHPTPLEHLEYINKIIPEIQVSLETHEWVKIMEEQVRSHTLTDWKSNNVSRL